MNEQIVQNQTQESKAMITPKASQIRTDFFDPIIWTQMNGMAARFIESGALSQSENTGTLIMKMQAGREMGMGPIESIKSFYFVKGIINIFGVATTRRLREHGWMLDFVDRPNSCTATITKGTEKYSDTLTYEDAQKSGWTHVNGSLKPGWLEGANRKLKLRYGTLSLLIKTYVPEVLGSATDIAEVADDMAPVISGESKVTPSLETKVAPEKASKPATPEQMKTITTLGGEAVEGITYEEATTKIKDLMKAKIQVVPAPTNG
jgi:hypothetical protein